MNRILFALILTAIGVFFFNTFLREKSENKFFNIVIIIMGVLVAIAIIVMWVALIARLIGGTL